MHFGTCVLIFVPQVHVNVRISLWMTEKQHQRSHTAPKMSWKTFKTHTKYQLYQSENFSREEMLSIIQPDVFFRDDFPGYMRCGGSIPRKNNFFWKLSNFVNFSYFLLQFFLLGRKHSGKAIFLVFLCFPVFTCISGAPTSDTFYTMYLQYTCVDVLQTRIWHQEYLSTNKLR